MWRFIRAILPVAALLIASPIRAALIEPKAIPFLPITVPVGQHLFSRWANTAPTINGLGTVTEWGTAASFNLPHGVMMIQNDEENLYVLLDITGDTVNDTPKAAAPWGDYYWVSFDIDRNNTISAGEDTNYAPLFVPGLKINPGLLYPLPFKEFIPPIIDIRKILYKPKFPFPPPVLKPILDVPIIKPIPLPIIDIPDLGGIMLQASADSPVATLPRWNDIINVQSRVQLPELNLRDTTRLAVQHFLGPCTWTGVQETDSREITGFGPSLNSAIPHRQFEFVFKLWEINAHPILFALTGQVPYVRMGLRINSQTPAFTDEVPASFCDGFARLTNVFLASRPTGGTEVGLGRWFRGVGLIPRQKINQTTGLATTDPGYYLEVTDAPFGGKMQIFGNWAFLRSQSAYRYRVVVQHNPGTGWSSWEPIKQAFGNYHLDLDGVLRYKTITPTPSEGWIPVPAAGDDDRWYLRDLISEWTSGEDGTARLKVEIQQILPGGGMAVVSPGDPDDSLVLKIVNTPPSLHLSVLHGADLVGPCAEFTLGPAPDGFSIRPYVWDARANLMSWNAWVYGPFGGSSECWSPAVTGGADSYASHAGPAGWTGPGLLSLNWRPKCSGCYQFHLQAWSRSTNGYTHILHTQTEPIPVKVNM